jgi:hypothetical protein
VSSLEDSDEKHIPNDGDQAVMSERGEPVLHGLFATADKNAGTADELPARGFPPSLGNHIKVDLWGGF